MITPSRSGPNKRSLSSSLSFDLRNLYDDQRGTIAVMTGLCAAALAGFTALAIDVASWQVAQRSMQGAADTAAYSAAIAYSSSGGTSYIAQAKGITASQGFVDGQNGATVAVNQPPTSGSYTSDTTAIEVVIQQPRPRLFSGLFLSSNPVVSARAVATVSSPACMLALSATASQAVEFNGSLSFISPGCDVVSNSDASNAINMVGSSTVTMPCLVAVGGIQVTSGLTLTACSSPISERRRSRRPLSASVPQPTPSGPCLSPVTSGNTSTFSPGTYCSGIKLTGSASATFQPGVYYIEGGNFAISGSATATGTGVTFFIASPSSVSLTGSQSATFTAPTSGIYSGIAFFGDRAGSPSSNNTFTGGSALTITGAIYFPTQSVKYSGGSASASNCTQLIADTIKVSGSAYFNSACQGDGMTDIGVHQRFGRDRSSCRMRGSCGFCHARTLTCSCAPRRRCWPNLKSLTKIKASPAN